MSDRAVKLLVVVLIVLATIGCDQVTKRIARSHLEGRGTVSVVGSVFVLRYVENEGAFLGLGGRLPAPLRLVFLVAFPLAALVGVIVAMLRSRSLPWALCAGLAFVAGGGFGNLFDRLFRHGRVSDFLNLGIGSFRTGIFNLADLAVLVGCVLLLLSGRERPRRTIPGAGTASGTDHSPASASPPPE